MFRKILRTYVLLYNFCSPMTESYQLKIKFASSRVISEPRQSFQFYLMSLMPLIIVASRKCRISLNFWRSPSKERPTIISYKIYIKVWNGFIFNHCFPGFDISRF